MITYQEKYNPTWKITTDIIYLKEANFQSTMENKSQNKSQEKQSSSKGEHKKSKLKRTYDQLGFPKEKGAHAVILSTFV